MTLTKVSFDDAEFNFVGEYKRLVDFSGFYFFSPSAITTAAITPTIPPITNTAADTYFTAEYNLSFFITSDFKPEEDVPFGLATIGDSGIVSDITTTGDPGIVYSGIAAASVVGGTLGNDKYTTDPVIATSTVPAPSQASQRSSAFYAPTVMFKSFLTSPPASI